MQIQDGTYAARPGAASVYYSEGGALVVALIIKLNDGPELKSYNTLVNKDGAINTRTVENLKKWSGWNGIDPFWLMDTDLSGIDVEVVVENQPSLRDPNKIFPNVKWINAPGGGGGGGIPEAADRRAVMAKFGSQFRALAGGTAVAQPVRAPAPQPAAAAPAAPARPPVQPTLPVGAPVRPRLAPVAMKPAGSTQASAWSKMCERGKGLDQAKLEAIWFYCVDGTGMDQADMTPAGWLQVEEAIEKHFTPAAAATAPEADDDNLNF